MRDPLGYDNLSVKRECKIHVRKWVLSLIQKKRSESSDDTFKKKWCFYQEYLPDEANCFFKMKIIARVCWHHGLVRAYKHSHQLQEPNPVAAITYFCVVSEIGYVS